MAAPTKETFADLKQQLAGAIALLAETQVQVSALTSQVDLLVAKVTTLEDRVAMAVNQSRGQRYAS